jgi:hypothetical protein
MQRCSASLVGLMRLVVGCRQGTAATRHAHAALAPLGGAHWVSTLKNSRRPRTPARSVGHLQRVRAHAIEHLNARLAGVVRAQRIGQRGEEVPVPFSPCGAALAARAGPPGSPSIVELAPAASGGCQHWCAERICGSRLASVTTIGQLP